jgi:serine/threonine protein kinase
VYEVGALLADKYRIDRVLGNGGMGVVVAATHVHLGQPVALKLLRDDLVDDVKMVARFVREARASAQLRSEHVCKVSDVGTLGSNVPYIVMELLAGRDLATLLEEAGPLPIALAVDYVLQACLGVAEAHARGIVHRDLKPANLFLTSRPDGSLLIKVLDFGIAKATKDMDFSLTRTDTVIGSPGYMAPEQLRSARDADTRTDVWGIGVTLFELIAGHAPFKADSLTELTLRVAMDPTPPLGVYSPPGFEQVIGHCLEKEPNARFQNVAELAYALAPFGGPYAAELASAIGRVLDVADRPLEVIAPVPSVDTMTAASGVTSGERRLRWRWSIAALAAVVVVLSGVVLGVTETGGDDSSSSVAPASAIVAPMQAPPSPPEPPPVAPAPTVPPPEPAPAPIAETPVSTPAAGSAAATVKPHKKPAKKPVTHEDYGATRF